MAGRFQHSPARLVQEFLVVEGYGTDPETDFNETTDEYGPWPVFRGREPDRPDDVVKVSDTTGRDDGFDNVSVEQCVHHGIQVTVRSADYDEGYRKLNQIAVALDELSYYLVTVTNDSESGTGSESWLYQIESVKRTTDVTPIGPDTPQGKRLLFTFNAVGTFRMCSAASDS